MVKNPKFLEFDYTARNHHSYVTSPIDQEATLVLTSRDGSELFALQCNHEGSNFGIGKTCSGGAYLGIQGTEITHKYQIRNCFGFRTSLLCSFWIRISMSNREFLAPNFFLFFLLFFCYFFHRSCTD